jgi:hypothetical protein
MSNYRVCMIEIERHELVKFMKFDSKEGAEHHAKNQSVTDGKHIYEVQKNNAGEFSKIKSYMNGQEV